MRGPLHWTMVVSMGSPWSSPESKNLAVCASSSQKRTVALLCLTCTHVPTQAKREHSVQESGLAEYEESNAQMLSKNKGQIKANVVNGGLD